MGQLFNFEWDEAKAVLNSRKHSVSFEEATTVFVDDLSLTGRDPDHSQGERRYLWSFCRWPRSRRVAYREEWHNPHHQRSPGDKGRKETL